MCFLRYELGFYIPEDDILYSHRRENLIFSFRKWVTFCVGNYAITLCSCIHVVNHVLVRAFIIRVKRTSELAIIISNSISFSNNKQIDNVVPSSLILYIPVMETTISSETSVVTRTNGITSHKTAFFKNSTEVPPKRRFLQEPHGVTSQKTPFFKILDVPKSIYIGMRAAKFGWQLQIQIFLKFHSNFSPWVHLAVNKNICNFQKPRGGEVFVYLWSNEAVSLVWVLWWLQPYLLRNVNSCRRRDMSVGKQCYLICCLV
jgi:hypothetical protein